MLCENVYVRTNIFLVNSIHVCDEMNKIDIISWKSATLAYASKWIHLNVLTDS